MGQPSLPLLNKVGYSMHWSSNWSNFVGYRKFLYFDFFVKRFFFFFFSDNVADLFIKKFYLMKDINILSKLVRYNKGKPIPIYVTTTWFLYYQNWVILTLFIYIPSIFLEKEEEVCFYKATYTISSLNFFKKKDVEKTLNKYAI